jgi:hypothetical protein
MGVKVSFLGSEMPQQTVAAVQGVMIAGEALRTDADGDFVWIIRDGAAERRSVELGGPADRPQVLISSGLIAGDVVVRNAATPLSSGQAVTTN